jgi:hypothetical protein
LRFQRQERWLPAHSTRPIHRLSDKVMTLPLWPPRISSLDRPLLRCHFDGSDRRRLLH